MKALAREIVVKNIPRLAIGFDYGAISGDLVHLKA